MLWLIGAYCSALAYATELSDRMLAATAAFTGAAMLALISDMASRSGSSSPPSAASSSSVKPLVLSVMVSSLDALVDVVRLDGVGVRRGVVRQDVGGHGRVHRDSDVGVDEGHGLAVGKLFACLRCQLLVAEALRAVSHVSSSIASLSRVPEPAGSETSPKRGTMMGNGDFRAATAGDRRAPAGRHRRDRAGLAGAVPLGPDASAPERPADRHRPGVGPGRRPRAPPAP